MQIKVLIFGEYTVFTLSLISRLKKENYQVLVVTGNSGRNSSKPSEVFQEYNFEYDSDSISYVLKSVDAEIVIFTAMYDTDNNWGSLSNQEARYISGLTNVMIHCKETNIKKFIYMSSCSIFEGNHEKFIDENVKPIPVLNPNKAILLGEKICTSYHKEAKFNVIVARVSEMYGKYKDDVLENNICTRICEQFVRDNTVTLNSNIKHNLIYVDDVVDSIYRIISQESVRNKIYHVSSQSSLLYSEKQLIKILEDITKKNINIEITQSNSDYYNHTYESQNIKNLGFVEKYDIKIGLRNVYSIVEKKVKNEEKKGRGIISTFKDLFIFGDITKKKVIPVFENAIFFLIIQLFIIFTMSLSFHEIIDIYLLYVIIVALIYGYLQAVFAVSFSILGKFYINLSWGNQYLALDDYGIIFWILQIFTVGVLVGSLRDEYKRKYEDLHDEKEHLRLELADIKNINKSNMEIKSLYEKRLINYKDSFARIFNIVSQLDAIEPERVIFKSVNVIKEIMSTNDVSVYTCDKNSEFCRLMAASSKKSQTMKKSMRISSHKEIYNKLKEQEIFVNSTLNPNYPIMAGGTYKDGHLQTIIMIWTLPFENNNLYEINVFGVLCKLVEKTMARAYEYMENINKSLNRKHRNILDSESFNKILQLYSYGKIENLVEYSLLKVKVHENISENAFYDLLKEQIRDIDYIGFSYDGDINILLTNANQTEAMYVVNRLENMNIIVKIGGRDEDEISDE